MVRIIHEEVIVKPGGIIEIRRADLPEGAAARVTVQFESVAGATPSLSSLIGSCAAGFTSSAEVDAHLRDLREEWERPWNRTS